MLNYNKYKIELQGDYMINLDLEKTLALDAQERYDVISFAVDAADDNGFINSFILERALYVYAAIMLYPEKKDEVSSLIVNNLISAWNALLNDGTIQEMQEKFKPTIDVLAEEAQIWCDEYADWAHSARGILDLVQQFTGNFVENAASRLQTTAEETGVNNIIDIANEWGMGRDALASHTEKEKEIDEESLFE